MVETINPHVGDYGYWLELVRGSANTTLSWEALTPEVIVRTPDVGRTYKALPDNVQVDRTEKVIRWRPAEDDLDVPGVYTVQVADAQAGQRQVLLTIHLSVDGALTVPLAT